MNVIQSYMVKLGFDVDTPAFSRFQGMMATAESSVTTHTGGMVKRILEFQAATVGAFTSVSVAIIGMVDNVAMADQSYRLLGMRMMMTTETARKMDMITKALGADLSQIIRDPELHQRAITMSDDIDRLTEKLGPSFEDGQKHVRDLRFEFERLELSAKFTMMGLANEIAKGLDLGGIGHIVSNIREWIEGIDTEKLSKELIPVLNTTWHLFEQIGKAAMAAGLMFTNVVGLLSHDTSIEGSAFSLEKMAKAIEHVGNWMTRFFGWITHAEELLAHFTSALALGLDGKFSDAAKEFKAGLKDLTGGSGMLLGATGGNIAGGIYGAIQGGITGAEVGSVLGPVGTAAGALLGAGTGATTGALGGTALGGVAGGLIGKLREVLTGDASESKQERESAPAPARQPAPAEMSPAVAARPAYVNRDIEQAIESAADRWGVPRSLALGVAKEESNFNQEKSSRKGAIGVMQLMPDTARDLGVDPTDVLQNIDGGVRYLSQMLARYQGDVNRALAAYNAGPGRVDRLQGNALPAETRSYVPRVLRYEREFSPGVPQAVPPAAPTAPVTERPVPTSEIARSISYLVPTERPAAQPAWIANGPTWLKSPLTVESSDEKGSAPVMTAPAQPTGAPAWFNTLPRFMRESPAWYWMTPAWFGRQDLSEANAGINRRIAIRDWTPVLEGLQRSPSPAAQQFSSNQSISIGRIDLGGINITEPGVDAKTIALTVQTEIRQALGSRTQFDSLQTSPAY